MALLVLKSRSSICHTKQGVAGTGSTTTTATTNRLVQVLQRQRGRSHSNCYTVELRFGFGLLLERRRAWSLRFRFCKNDVTKAAAVAEEEDEDDVDKFVKMTREVQPYVRAHRNSTLVVILSAEIVDSPYSSSILEIFSRDHYLCKLRKKDDE